MRILALRVRNLASLAGDVVIDFEAAPLAHAGLFAITGPTGAGKSTLLDALCLALYDRLPRLASAPRSEVGRAGEERIAGDDVRTILRHGAAEGFAEVDFRGRDGHSYRARWEVRRARGKASGRLQAQTMALSDLATGAALGGGKRETLDAIRDKAGLDYDQFRRSVLLAQNEFDAFLKARPAERAELLELMTGTGIYGALSVAAHERCKQEKARLDALDEELARVNVLADDQRAALEAEAAQADEEVARLAAELEALNRDLDFYRSEAQFRARIAEAEARCARAADALAGAESERLRLAEVKRALMLRPLVAEADRLAAERERTLTERDQARDALAGAQTLLAEATAARDAARDAEEEAEAAFRAAGPDLDQAADLDARIAEGAARLDRRRAQAVATRAQVAEAETTLAALTSEHDAALAKQARIEAWLAANQGRKPLAEQLERWLDAIAEHGRAAAEAWEADRAARQAAERLRGLQAERDEALARRQELDAALNEVGAEGDGDEAGLEARRDRLAALLDALARRDGEERAGAALAQRGDELSARRLDCAARRDEAEAALAALADERKTLDATLAEARRARDLAEAAEGEQAERLRERLVEGEPCPVCGSRRHPLGTHALTALLGAHRDRVRELEAQADELADRRQHWLARQASAGDGLLQSERDLAGIEAEAAKLATRLADAAAAVAELAAVLGLAAPDRPSCEAERAAIAETLRALRERRALRQALSAEAHGLAERLAAMAAQSDALAAEAERARADGERAAATLARLDGLLAAPLEVVPNWRDGLDTAPAQLAEACRRLGEEWRRGEASLDAERDAVRGLASKLEAARAARDNARLNAEGEARVLADEDSALARLKDQRARLFDGRPTAQVRTALNESRKAAKAAHDLAQHKLAEAGRAHGMAEARETAATARLAELESALAAALAARDGRLAELALDLASIREAIGLGDAWVVGTEARLAELHQAQTSALAVLAERRDGLLALETAGRPERTHEEVAALLPGSTAARERAHERASSLRGRLKDDDRRRGEAEDTRARVAKQRATHDLWRGMADLIGSADGSKFRRFAQGLTLDRLLGLANAHLAELTARYVLERSPSGDLDLQVRDRDMADEVRGVASLSGGERFLVSLALALGLASMSGSRVLAESLFIDEGFGALDSDSLDVAISALETLHASGRRVGVISHVQAMIDRIGVQVRVTKLGGGRSGVEVRAG